MKTRLYDSIWTHFWGIEQWRLHQQCYGKERALFEQLMKHLCMGFNFPPSQYQLHMHGLLPPFTPEHHRLFVQGKHFVKGRWFPLSYIEQALKTLIDRDEVIERASEMEISEVIACLSDVGVCYEQEYERNYLQYQQSQSGLWSWQPTDFEALLFAGRHRLTMKPQKFLTLTREQRVQNKKKDKSLLQNWKNLQRTVIIWRACWIKLGRRTRRLSPCSTCPQRVSLHAL